MNNHIDNTGGLHFGFQIHPTVYRITLPISPENTSCKEHLSFEVLMRLKYLSKSMRSRCCDVKRLKIMVKFSLRPVSYFSSAVRNLPFTVFIRPSKDLSLFECCFVMRHTVPNSLSFALFVSLINEILISFCGPTSYY